MDLQNPVVYRMQPLETAPTITQTPSYRLHKPSGQAVVTIDSRDFYLGRFGTPKSHAEYDRLVAEWLQKRTASACRK